MMMTLSGRDYYMEQEEEMKEMKGTVTQECVFKTLWTRQSGKWQFESFHPMNIKGEEKLYKDTKYGYDTHHHYDDDGQLLSSFQL